MNEKLVQIMKEHVMSCRRRHSWPCLGEHRSQTNQPFGSFAIIAQFSFRKTLFSKLALVLLRFLAVKSPQTENKRSTYACEAGAATRSRANPPMYLYCDSFDSQYCTASVSSVRCSRSAIYVESSSWVDVPLPAAIDAAAAGGRGANLKRLGAGAWCIRTFLVNKKLKTKIKTKKESIFKFVLVFLILILFSLFDTL